jgi:hypothetical protein
MKYFIEICKVKMNKNFSPYIGLLLVMFMSVSCEKKDKPLSLPPKGDGTIMQLDMGENYNFQYFVNLEEERIVHISRNDTWDLAFESNEAGKAVYLNAAKNMAAYNTGKTTFDAVGKDDATTATRNWKVDNWSGKIDSTSIGDWTTKKEIYIIRLNGDGSKMCKLQIVSVDAFEYKIKLSEMSTDSSTDFTIPKNKDQHFTYFNLSTLTTVSGVEPLKNTWDIVSTLYSHTFYDQNPPLPYVVNGFLLNPEGEFL